MALCPECYEGFHSQCIGPNDCDCDCNYEQSLQDDWEIDDFDANEDELDEFFIGGGTK